MNMNDPIPPKSLLDFIERQRTSPEYHAFTRQMVRNKQAVSGDNFIDESDEIDHLETMDLEYTQLGWTVFYLVCFKSGKSMVNVAVATRYN